MLIHVTCPSCSEPYDIADTFAGGVYRCTKCNTLMSVPKKHTPPAATNVAPGMGKAASPDDIESGAASSSGISRSSARSSRPVAKAAPKAAARPGVKPGQKPGAKPEGLAAYKWHLVSFGALVLIAVVVVIVVNMAKGKEVKVVEKVAPITQRPTSNYAFTYAKGVLVNDKPNVLGLPLTGNVTVVVDGGSETNAVRPYVHKLLEAGLTGKVYDKPSFAIMYANGEPAATVPSTPLLSVNPADSRAKLQDFLGKVKLTNAKRDDISALKAGLQHAVDQVIANQTRHVVLVLGRSLTTYSQNQLVSVMEGAFSQYHTHFDLVVVDADPAGMPVLTDEISATQGVTAPVTATMVQSAANGLK